MRAAGGGLQSEAFAGDTTWDGAATTLSWSHDLDMHPGGLTDSGRVEWLAGELVEHGAAERFGDPIRYTEVWTQRATPGAHVVIADRVGGRGRLAWAGRFGAVTIDDQPAGPLQGGVFTDRGWALVFDIVQGLPLGSGERPLPPAGLGTRFERWHTSWRIVESATVAPA